jgi:hypothetical protein
VEAKMTNEHSLGDLLHRATHRVPGVPAHVERTAGHQGATVHGHARHHGGTRHPSANRRWNHSPDRAPRVMRDWQRRIAALVGREL